MLQLQLFGKTSENEERNHCFDGDCIEETTKWVERLNGLAAEMDATATSLHISAWPEVLREQNTRYKELAAKGP